MGIPLKDCNGARLLLEDQSVGESIQQLPH